MRGEGMKPINLKTRCGQRWIVKGGCGGPRPYS